MAVFKTERLAWLASISVLLTWLREGQRQEDGSRRSGVCSLRPGAPQGLFQLLGSTSQNICVMSHQASAWKAFSFILTCQYVRSFLLIYNKMWGNGLFVFHAAKFKCLDLYFVVKNMWWWLEIGSAEVPSSVPGNHVGQLEATGIPSCSRSRSPLPYAGTCTQVHKHRNT